VFVIVSLSLDGDSISKSHVIAAGSNVFVFVTLHYIEIFLSRNRKDHKVKN